VKHYAATSPAAVRILRLYHSKLDVILRFIFYICCWRLYLRPVILALPILRDLNPALIIANGVSLDLEVSLTFLKQHLSPSIVVNKTKKHTLKSKFIFQIIIQSKSNTIRVYIRNYMDTGNEALCISINKHAETVPYHTMPRPSLLHVSFKLIWLIGEILEFRQ